MTDDVRISVGLRRHRKTKRLKKLLGADGCWALVCLFLWAGEDRWTGDLSGLTDDDIETEADWDGEPGAFVTALVDVGFLIGEAGSRAIKDWQEHNPYAATKGQRIEKGKRAAAARWSKDAPSMPGACPEHAGTKPKQCPPAPAPTTQDQDQEQDQKRARNAPSPADLFPDVDPNHLRDWVAARKAKRLPLTETAAKGFRNAAARAGMTAAEAVKFCAEKGWAGLHADNGGGVNPRGSPPPKAHSSTHNAAATLLAGTSHAQRFMDQRRDPPRLGQDAESAAEWLPPG